MIQTTLTTIAPLLSGRLLGEDVHFTGCHTDSSQPMQDHLFVALKGERFDGHDFLQQAQQQGAAAALVEQPVTTDLPCLQVTNTRQALGQLAKFWRQQFTLPIIAITGSNGKTSTKEMLKAIFGQQSTVLATSGNLNNDIGVPLTVFQLNATHQYAVIEMGANHAGEIAYLTELVQPTVAVITQCAPAHLAGFQSIDGVAQAKGEIFSHLPPTATAVINVDDHYADLWQDLAKPRSIITFGKHASADVQASEIHSEINGSDFQLQTFKGKIAVQLAVPGDHNVMNALAAAACALACGCDLLTIKNGLQQCQPVKGRLQQLKGYRDTVIIDDTYNANPTSLQAALTVLSQYSANRWLVLGDMKELGEQAEVFHTEAGKMAKAKGISRLWAIGELSQFAVMAFGQGGCHFPNHQQLITALRTALQQTAETVVLMKGSRSMHLEQVVQALCKKED